VFNRFSDGSIATMRRLVILSFLCVTLGWFLFGISPTLLWAAFALIVRASGGSVTWTYSSTILQLSTADAYMGRVFALDWMGFNLAVTVSTLVTGLLIEQFGQQRAPAIALGNTALSLIPIAGWVWAVIWLERRAAAQLTHEAKATGQV
jgi:MFS family permease